MSESFGWIPTEYCPERAPEGVTARVWLLSDQWRWSVQVLNRKRNFLGRLTEFYEHGRCESLGDAWDACIAAIYRAEDFINSGKKAANE